MKPEPIEHGSMVADGVVNRRYDTVGEWLAGLGSGTFSASGLYRSYVEETGDMETRPNAFGMILRRHGLIPAKVRGASGQLRVWTKL